MSTYLDIIDRFDSRADVAAACSSPGAGVTVDQVSTMRSRAGGPQIPRKYWAALRVNAARFGVVLTRGELEDAEIAYQTARAVVVGGHQAEQEEGGVGHHPSSVAPGGEECDDAA